MSNELTMIKPEVGAIELTANGVQMRDVAQVFAFCELLGKAGMLPKGATTDSATVAVIAGARLGLDAFQAVQGIASINGRPSLWGDAMIAVVKASGLVEDETVEYVPNARECKGVRYTIKRKGIATPYEGTFTQADAEKAGLWGKTGPWTQYPKRMLLCRARAFALRDGFADVLKGFGSAEEERDVVDAEVVTTPKRKRASAAEVMALEDAPKTLSDAGARHMPDHDVAAEADVVPIPGME